MFFKPFKFNFKPVFSLSARLPRFGYFAGACFVFLFEVVECLSCWGFVCCCLLPEEVSVCVLLRLISHRAGLWWIYTPISTFQQLFVANFIPLLASSCGESATNSCFARQRPHDVSSTHSLWKQKKKRVLHTHWHIVKEAHNCHYS